MRLILRLFLFISLFIVGSVILSSTSYAQTLGEIIIQPGNPTGKGFTADVMVNTGSEQVNAVQVNILVPTTLTATQINTSGSAFEIQAENKISQGLIKIARGTVTPKTGVQKLATITFTGTGSVGDLRVSEDSAIIRSTDNKNIYSGSQNYYSENSVNSPTQSNQSYHSIQSAPTTNNGTSVAVTNEKKGFFDRIIDWNNALWEKILGAFS